MNEPRPRRWFQLSLRSLFVLTLVVAAFFGGYSLAEKRAQRAVRAAEERANQAELDRLKLRWPQNEENDKWDKWFDGRSS